LRLSMAAKAVRQMRSPRSADFDMSRVVRPYTDKTTIIHTI
jgi:hypothetical protein